jgi:hypothetical protein
MVVFDRRGTENMNLLKPWTWTKLDPARTKAARTHFDEAGRFNQWHDLCREHFSRTPGASGGELFTDGVEVVRCLDAQEAATQKENLIAKAMSMASTKAAIDYADVMQFSDSAFMLPVVEKMLNPTMDDKLTAILGSEYFVYSLVVNRTFPSKESKRSFLWHCDRGPKDFLKINMFLDATSAHGGTTEFIDLENSLAYEKAGYTFGANQRRLEDLTRLNRKLNISPKVIHPQLDAGEAFVFYPARTMHRGFLPTKGTRHMFSIVLLPSPVRWRAVWDATVKSGYHLKTNAAFPADAFQIFDDIGLPIPERIRLSA